MNYREFAEKWIAAEIGKKELPKTGSPIEMFSEMYDMAEDNPADAFEVTKILIELAPTTLILAIVAAGPLEDIPCKHDLQKILGHTSLEMTQRYAHMSPDHLAKAIEIVSFSPKNEENVTSIESARNKNSG